MFGFPLQTYASIQTYGYNFSHPDTSHGDNFKATNCQSEAKNIYSTENIHIKCLFGNVSATIFSHPDTFHGDNF